MEWRLSAGWQAVRIAAALVILLPSLPGQKTRAAEHDAAAPRQFDNASALKYSQAAIGRTIGDYVLTDRESREVRLSRYHGRPLVVSLIYTSCYHICPTTTRHLASVVKKARDALGRDSFNVVTIGFDVENDTPRAMKYFAGKQGVDLPGWQFLSGDAVTIKRLAADLGFVFFRSPKGFDHLIQATVIDSDGKIYRQVYGMNFDTPLLVEPLKELVFGRPSGASLLDTIGNRIRLFCTVYDPASDSYRFDYSIFVGMFIGATTLGFIAFMLVREWRRSRS